MGPVHTCYAASVTRQRQSGFLSSTYTNTTLVHAEQIVGYSAELVSCRWATRGSQPPVWYHPPTSSTAATTACVLLIAHMQLIVDDNGFVQGTVALLGHQYPHHATSRLYKRFSETSASLISLLCLSPVCWNIPHPSPKAIRSCQSNNRTPQIEVPPCTVRDTLI